MINLFLKNCEKAAVSDDVLPHYQGVARFFRARFYMNKVKRFSDVPWYDKTRTTPDESLYKARDARDFLVQKLFEDFQFAAEHVKTSQETGSVDKWVVLTYMARFALYEGTYRKYHDELNLQSSSLTYLKMPADAALQIMNEGGFSIYTTGDADHDYHALFESPDLSTNPEIILATCFDKKIKGNGFWAFMFGNYIPCPTKDLVQSYLMKDGSYYSAQSGYETKQFVEEFQNRDPRMCQTLE